MAVVTVTQTMATDLYCRLEIISHPAYSRPASCRLKGNRHACALCCFDCKAQIMQPTVPAILSYSSIKKENAEQEIHHTVDH